MTMHELICYAGFLVAIRLGWIWREWKYKREEKAKAVVDSLEVVIDLEEKYSERVDKC